MWQRGCNPAVGRFVAAQLQNLSRGGHTRACRWFARQFAIFPIALWPLCYSRAWNASINIGICAVLLRPREAYNASTLGDGCKALWRTRGALVAHSAARSRRAQPNRESYHMTANLACESILRIHSPVIG